MTFKLSRSIAVGQQIKTSNGWRKVLEVTSEGARVAEGFVMFGEVVYGWKAA